MEAVANVSSFYKCQFSGNLTSVIKECLENVLI